MKKLTALLLTLALLLSALPAFAESEGKWDGPVEQIIMTWLTGGVDNPYLDKAAEKINEITREKIGVEVSFRQESVFTAASSYTLWRPSSPWACWSPWMTICSTRLMCRPMRSRALRSMTPMPPAMYTV